MQGTQCIWGLQSLPDQKLATSLHYNMTDGLKMADMRLLCIEQVLQWDRLYVFEHAPAEAYQTRSYSETDDEMWSKTAVLSWRWAETKPPILDPGFSPMSVEQFQELKSMLYSVQAATGLAYVWIDWCCAPQYSEDKAATMVEVLRSKVYYMRARQLLLLPAFERLPKEHRLVKALEGIHLLLCQHFGHSKTAALLLSAVNLLLEHSSSQSHVLMASHDYYRRIWTLAERMARHGGREKLCNCMPLQTWVGMVLHAVDSWNSKARDSSVCFQSSLGSKDIWDQASAELSNNQGAPKALLALLLNAVFTWHQSPPSGMNAAPTKEWLRSYLEDAHSDVYQAWDVSDKVWGIYSYFSAAMCSKSLTDLLGALRKLVQLATGSHPAVCLSQLLHDDDATNEQQAAAIRIQELLVLAAVDVKAAVVSACVLLVVLCMKVGR